MTYLKKKKRLGNLLIQPEARPTSFGGVFRLKSSWDFGKFWFSRASISFLGHRCLLTMMNL